MAETKRRARGEDSIYYDRSRAESPLTLVGRQSQEKARLPMNAAYNAAVPDGT